jgi:hypothetical protein
VNPRETGYLLRALGYFNYAADGRALTAARALARRLENTESALAALWGWRDFDADAEVAEAARECLERVMEARASDVAADAPYTFPQFDPRDPLFFLRILAEHKAIGDRRAAPYLEALVQKQNERAQWRLEHSLNAELVIPLEPQGEPSRWLTLNALRIIVKLVQSAG